MRDERVDIKIMLVWQSSNPRYNGKTYSMTREERAEGHSGSWRETLKTSEVPSGVTALATVTAKGRTSQRLAQGVVRIK